VRFTDDPAVRHRIVFLPDYGISLAQALYPGCDVWLNNPLRPLEACGTSGMKAALNGGLNLSILDGWWDEMYDGQNGWAIPTADGVDDVDKRDDLEAAALYDLVEHQVAPRFYDRGEHGLPHRWIEMVRHTLKTLGTKVVAERMLRDYVLQLYTPAALSARAVDGTAGHPKARELAAWKARVRAAWDGVAVEHLEVSGLSSAPELGEQMHVRAFLALGEIKPADVQVQVVHGRVDSDDRLSHPATTALDLSETYEAGRYCFEGQVALQSTGPFGYTVRVVPSHPLLSGPAELGLAAVPSTTAPAEIWSD
jgi:glycogen phosphorylase